MKNPFNKQAIQQAKEILNPRQVKLVMSNIGEVMIDGLMFSFSIESAGKPSEHGFCVTISGEAVDDGRVTFTDFQVTRQIKGKSITKKTDIAKITKSDGKKIYQAKFENIPIVDAPENVSYKKMNEQELMQTVNSQIAFKLMPHFSGDDMPELMISIYPYENILTGAATEWVKITSDQDYFLNKFSSKKKKRR